MSRKTGTLAARQRGVALLVGLIVLLIMTIIGISAIRNSTQQERMSASNQQQAQTFQAAESAIELTMAYLQNVSGTNVPSGTPGDFLTTAIGNGLFAPPLAYPPPSAPASPNRVINLVANAGATFTASANFYHTGTAPAAGASIGKFTAYLFDINAVAQQPATGATVNNVQGVAFVGPREIGS